jgi:hypothetical protein
MRNDTGKKVPFRVGDQRVCPSSMEVGISVGG